MLSSLKPPANSSNCLQDSMFAKHLQNNYTFTASNTISLDPLFRQAESFNSSQLTESMARSPFSDISDAFLQNPLQEFSNPPAQYRSNYKHTKDRNNSDFQTSLTRTTDRHDKFLKRAILNKDLPPLPFRTSVIRVMPSVSTAAPSATSKVCFLSFREILFQFARAYCLEFMFTSECYISRTTRVEVHRVGFTRALEDPNRLWIFPF